MYHVCTISCVQPISSQFSMSYPCLISPSSDCTVRRGQCMKHSSVSEPSFSSNLHTNCLFPFFFSHQFIPLIFIFSIPGLPAPLSLYSSSSPAITSLHPFPHSVFSPFYSIVFPSTESAHVQGPDAAGCHHGVEVSIQFAGNTCGSQHPAPSYHTCCGHCHLQPPICR